MEGSYNFTNEEFIGSQSTPWIDTHSSHPGPGWTLLDKPPVIDDVSIRVKGAFIMQCGNKIKEFLEEFGPKLLTIVEINPNLQENKIYFL